MKTRDADRFYLLLNEVVASGEVNVESVAPVDDDLSAVYQYLIGTTGEALENFRRRRKQMSTTLDSIPVKPSKETLPWSLWLRQIGAYLRLEVEKNFLGRRINSIYLITFLPLFPLLILAVVTPPASEWKDFQKYAIIYSILYNGLILRTVVFFGCAWIFMNLFRGELASK